MNLPIANESCFVSSSTFSVMIQGCLHFFHSPISFNSCLSERDISSTLIVLLLYKGARQSSNPRLSRAIYFRSCTSYVLVVQFRRSSISYKRIQKRCQGRINENHKSTHVSKRIVRSPTTMIKKMNNQGHLTFQQVLGQRWFPLSILSFLDGEDAIRFSSVSRDCRLVNLQPPLPLESCAIEDWAPRNVHDPKFWQYLPTLASAHTVFLKCNWVDQGWGNRKGEIFVVARGGDETDWSSVRHSIACRSEERARHKWSTLSLRFRPESDQYGIWYRVGGGGGHELNVKDLSVRVLAYTNAQDDLECEQQRESKGKRASGAN